MLNVWDKSKIVLYFEDEEGDKLVSQTISNVTEDPSDEAVEMVADAFDALSGRPLNHLILTHNQRYAF